MNSFFAQDQSDIAQMAQTLTFREDPIDPATPVGLRKPGFFIVAFGQIDHPVFQAMAIGKFTGSGNTHDEEKAALLNQLEQFWMKC